MFYLFPAMQPQLLPLLSTLPDQTQSIYQLLSLLEQKANSLLQHICRAGNGSIPKPPKKGNLKKKDKDRSHHNDDHEQPSSSTHDPVAAERTAEEKLARFVIHLILEFKLILKKELNL